MFREALARPGNNDPEDKWNERRTHYHADLDTRTVLLRSSDDGATWGASSRVVIDESDGTQDLNMPLITELSSGELIVVNHRWSMGLNDEEAEETKARRLVRRSAPSTAALDSMYLMRSGDRGLTWSEPAPLSVPSFEYAALVGKTAVVELPDGAWLMPIYDAFPGDAANAYCVIRSRDGGRTWGEPSTVAHDPEGRIQFHEPPILRLPSGRLLTVIRTAEAGGYLYQAFSDDEGWTWRGLKRTPIWGLPCHLLRLDDGRILCSYGYRREPFGVRAVLSEDEGETWDMDREIVIRDDGLHQDLGYPASVQLRSGRILTVYYFHGEDGIRYIGGSVFDANGS